MLETIIKNINVEMLVSILIVCLIYAIWVFAIFAFELSYELAIVPLKDVKRKFLINMSKRKFDKKIQDSDFDDDTTIEEDNMLMKKIESIVYKFIFKYVILAVILLIVTVLVPAITKSHLEVLDIFVFLVAGWSVAFLLAKHKAEKERNNEKLFNTIKRYLKLDDRYVSLIRNYLKEEATKKEKDED